MEAIWFVFVPTLGIIAVWLIIGYIRLRYMRLVKRNQEILDEIASPRSFTNFIPMIWETRNRRLKK